MTCESVIQACDQALSDKNNQILIRDQALGQAQAILSANAKEISDLKHENDVWYNQKWIWVGLGAAGTAYLLKH